MFSKLKRFIGVKLNWLSVIMVVLAAIGVAVGFFIREISYQVISAMFLLIAVENFVTKIAYMDDMRGSLEGMRTRLDELSPLTGGGIHIKNRDECVSLPQTIKDATHDLFISGVHLQALTHVFDALVARNDLRVKVLLLNLDNHELVKAHMDMKGFPDLYHPTFEHLWRIRGHEHIEIRRINSIMPLVFVASDIDTAHGYIKAEHYFNNMDNSLKLPNIELTPINSEWYDVYKEQIASVWERGEVF